MKLKELFVIVATIQQTETYIVALQKSHRHLKYLTACPLTLGKRKRFGKTERVAICTNLRARGF